MMEVAETTGIWVRPEIPSKYDVVPIHNSDRASFKRCRRYFDWSSPTRHNLSLRADVHGINTDLFFGTGIHWALEQYYTPNLRRDPVEAWKTWFNIQWRGGEVAGEWLDRVYDLKPRARTVHSGSETFEVYVVRGLEDILPDADHSEFDDLFELGCRMMEYYKDYSVMHDGFEVLVAEHDFSIPIWDYEHNRILTAIDLREHSPNYGKELEVHSRGRMDGIWVKPNGKLGVIDHKTSSRIDEDFFEKLETDEQVTSYLHAAEVEAKYYNLPYAGEIMEECIYNVLRKVYAKPPTMVRGGLFSVDKANESTTYDMLMAFIEEHGIDFDSLDEKHKTYVDYVQQTGEEQFIVRKLVRRNRHQLMNAGMRLYEEAMDMLQPKLRMYPNFTSSHTCIKCQFRMPCLAKETGADWEQLINDNYTVTRDR